MAISTYNCFCFTRKFKIAEIQPPDDVRRAFETYADGVGGGGGPTISADGLRRFLVESQGEKRISSAEVTRLMEKLRGGDATGPKHYLEKIIKPSGSNFLTIEEFYHFLFSPEINPPIKHEVHQDMTLPISHYYIFTGHNSYLTGNQLSSDCSDIPIIKALQRGVRVIELDMWPNSTRDNVDILHGRTLTSPVEIIKCLRSIKEYAFCASPYPVVITLEDHLTPNLQAKVAEMIKETFGDILYIPDDEPLTVFPSPEDLKHRIIISTKPPKEYLESKDQTKTTGSQRSSNGNATSQRISGEEADDAGGKDLSDLKSESSNDKDEDESEEDEEDPKFGKDTAYQYRKLITIQAGKPKGASSTKDALQVDPTCVRRLSLSEQKLTKACTSHSADVIRFTQRNLLRVYPKGTRVRSTNYKPMLAWTHGAQMVAFNTQGHCKQLRLMQGFFRANGGCGYVRKPDFLMNMGPNGEVFDPSVSLPVKQTLKVKIYMGDGWRMDFSKTHFDAYSPPDFYVKVGIEGVPDDTLMKKTKVIEDDWIPVWDEEFSYPLTVPELALLRIEVKEYDMSEKHDFGGQSCLPVSELRPGIRAVPLYNKKGSVYKSVRLLMRFKFV
ncbi:phosphoinositide phospholipase C 4-like isoform X2 [Carex littledalei]|uniref:Phosphoinositide phospholipase C n=1 Tax=Carex littledalei TaxID=544730 RepID=A0A833QYH0_9POAL|nr:phosphoinositide phospholipase C 4-like isoform X2 [Carex littledalei]